MFPALASTASADKQPVASAWGASTGPRIKVAAPKSKGVTDSFTLSAIDVSHAGRDGKATSLGDVMKNTMTKFKVKVEASTQRKTGQTTFFIKSESEKEVEKAKRHLVAILSPTVSRICAKFAMAMYTDFLSGHPHRSGPCIHHCVNHRS